MTYTYKGGPDSHILGNFWGDYKSADQNNNGLGDTIYTSNGIRDTYPLVASHHQLRPRRLGQPDAEPHGHAGTYRQALGNPDAHRNPDSNPAHADSQRSPRCPQPRRSRRLRQLRLRRRPRLRTAHGLPAPTALTRPASTAAPERSTSTRQCHPAPPGIDRGGHQRPGRPARTRCSPPTCRRSPSDKAINLFGNGHK